MKLHKLSHSLVAGAFTMLAAAATQAGTVWDQRYEEYIDVDFPQTIICATKSHSESSELVYNSNYETYVPADFQRHVIRSDEIESTGRLVYRAEYEAYVPESLAGVTLGSAEGCAIS